MTKLFFVVCTLLTSNQFFAQVNTFPYIEDFEAEGQGSTSCGVAQTLLSGWQNDTTDDIDWASDMNGTGSTNTGPTANGGADHNPGIAGGIYLYTESSGCNGDTARLISPEIQTNLSMPNLAFDFWYHMFGANIDNPMFVGIRQIVGGVPQAWVGLDTIPADNQDLWQLKSIDLAAFIGDTFQLSITAVTGSSFGSDYAIDDIQIYPVYPDDAGVTSIDNPFSPIVAGVNNVDVTLKNFGSNTLTSANIAWSVNGTLQVPAAWSGSVPYLGSDGPFTVGSYNFPNGIHKIKAWTESPNGTTDGQNTNDTTEIVVCTPLSGTYVLGGTGADFADLNELSDILSNCGVSANTVINVTPGTYSGRLILDHVPGTSASATITINGGDTSLVTFTNNSFSNIFFNGTSYTTVKNITLENTGTADIYGVQLTDTAMYNTLDSLRIKLPQVVGISDAVGVSASNSETSTFGEAQNALFTTVSNCHISGGDKGIHFEGENADRTPGNTFTNNLIENVDDYGFYMDDQDSLTIVGNRIVNIVSSFGDGIYCFDLMDFNISYNEAMNVPDYGLYISDGNFNLDGVPGGRSTIVNNMISSQSDYAAYFDDFELTDIYHNTFYGEPGIRLNDIIDLDIQNNIFKSDADYAFETDDDPTTSSGTITVIDYNAYYSESTLGLVDIGVTVHPDLTSWQTAQPVYNAFSVETDPVFVGGKADLHVLSPGVNNVGNNAVGITDDIDGDVRPASGAVFVDPGADEFTPIPWDIELLGFITPPLCGDSNAPLYVIIRNLGTNDIVTFDATADITGDLTTMVNFSYVGPSIPFNSIDTIFIGSINTYWGINYSADVWVDLIGDTINANDSLFNIDFLVRPFEPVGIDGYACGDTSGYIYATPLPGVFYNWYASNDVINDTVPIASADSLMVPNYTLQDTYYLEYANNSDSLETTMAAGNGCGGGNMFDLTAINDVSITGVGVHNSETPGTVINVNVHYIPNGSYLGNQTVATNWTLLGNFTAVSNGTGVVTPVDFGGAVLPISAGETYAIYIEYNAQYTNGSSVYANTDISIQMGDGLCSAFGGVNTGREFNGRIYYGSEACSPIRVPVTLQPGVLADPTFTSTPTAAGNVVDFAGSTAAQNVAWTWDFGNGSTATGQAVQGTFTPDSTFSICLTATSSSCGDSTMCMDIDICETMTPAYSFNQVGDGYTFDFTDNTTGTPTSWAWDFGDGNTSTMQNPSHTYASTDSAYTVTLTVTNYCGDTETSTQTIDALDVNSLSIEESLVVSPNPSSGVFLVEYLGEVAGGVNMVIYDAVGRTVMSESIDSNGNWTKAINLTAQPDGTYFLKVQLNDRVIELDRKSVV